MTDWPSTLTIDPIGTWPKPFTAKRRRSSFEASLASTTELLSRELRMLGAEDARLQVAIRPGDFRLDGRPRANAVAEHPGVILTLQSKHGPLSYPCDTFTDWRANLRAIALSLESLRRVDRYGVTTGGEQYRGFLAIESAAAPAAFASVEEAWAYLERTVNYWARRGEPARLIRGARRITHPDHGGSAGDFQRVSDAERFLRAAGAM